MKKGQGGFTLVELLIVTAIVSVVVLAVSKFFLDFYGGYQEMYDRLRMQRDLNNLAYYLRKDVSAMVRMNGNFDMTDDGFMFLALDSPEDKNDWFTYTSDGDLDTFTYQLKNDRIVERQVDYYPGKVETTGIALEALDSGDSFSWNITVTYLDGDTATVSDYDNTLGNFERDTPVLRVDFDLTLEKPHKFFWFKDRPPIIESRRISTVAIYKRGRE